MPTDRPPAATDARTAPGFFVLQLRGMACRSLSRMYDARSGLFLHCLRRHGAAIRPEGISLRYTAIVAIAFAQETPPNSAEILQGKTTDQLVDALVDRVATCDDLGGVALTAWAARACHHKRAAETLHRLRAMDPAGGRWPTVELAWVVTGLSIASQAPTDESLREAVAQRLLASQHPATGLFPHWPVATAPSRWRSHVCCFADKVYPIQALAHYSRATGDGTALGAANHCAETMCRCQGPGGQWFWHFDVRTARVVEGFPIYAVHQDAMGPMALFALAAADRAPHLDAIKASLRWLQRPIESRTPLVDTENDLVWRKVARHEPGKLARSLQAMASGIHPALRVPGLDLILRVGWIDYECRPYHMAWILYTWQSTRLAKLGWA